MERAARGSGIWSRALDKNSAMPNHGRGLCPITGQPKAVDFRRVLLLQHSLARVTGSAGIAPHARLTNFVRVIGTRASRTRSQQASGRQTCGHIIALTTTADTIRTERAARVALPPAGPYRCRRAAATDRRTAEFSPCCRRRFRTIPTRIPKQDQRARTRRCVRELLPCAAPRAIEWSAPPRTWSCGGRSFGPETRKNILGQQIEICCKWLPPATPVLHSNLSIHSSPEPSVAVQKSASFLRRVRNADF
jgi:hypothetical protein